MISLLSPINLTAFIVVKYMLVLGIRSKLIICASDNLKTNVSRFQASYQQDPLTAVVLESELRK